MAVALAVYVGTASEEEAPRKGPEAALQALAEESLPTRVIAETLGVPESVPISYKVEGRGIVVDSDGVIHIDFRVRAASNVTNLFASNLEAEIGDLVLERLDGLIVADPSSLTGQTSQGDAVSLRLKVADALPVSTSSSALAEKAGFAPGRVLGWGKGCNSWPW